jgi:hypothetical protein
MRVLASLLTAAVLVGALAGCAKNTSQETSTTSTAAPETATTAPANVAMAPQAAMTKLPVYPGAKTEAAGSTSSVGMGGTASGSVMSTTDAFDKVYKWYQAHMPAGSERTHVTAAGTESAVFVIGPASKNQQSVTISKTAATGGKTMITLAQVKR